MSDKNQNGLIFSPRKPKRKIVIGIPMTGLLRSEWVMARYGQIIPTNWGSTDLTANIPQISPVEFAVADARNIIVNRAVENGADWVIFIDHDVVVPRNLFVKINEYIRKPIAPIVNGLYFTRSVPSEPLIYRGRGNSYYTEWKMGDKVWADGAGLGCTLIDANLLKAVYLESEEYIIPGFGKAKKIFDNPCSMEYNEETGVWSSLSGTEDLLFYSTLQEKGFYKKAGWDEFQDKEFPLLIDTNLFCYHIDWDGVQYPSRGEQFQFFTEEQLARAKNRMLRQQNAKNH